MSIDDCLSELVESGRLIDRPSAYLGIQARCLYVVPEIDGHTRPPFPDTELGERWAAVAQRFDAFCELGMITVSQNPRAKPSDTMLARAHPTNLDIWSMRILEPEGTSGIRILGAFVGKDAFVALAWELRENIANFDEEVRNAHSVWQDHFGTYSPHSGRSLDDYITNYDEQ